VSTQNIPLVDLRAQHAEIADEVAAGFADVMANTSFVGGPAVAEFEQEFAAFVGAQHCVGVGNGTDAIELMLLGLGIGRGDEVIVPANTFIATAEAVVRAGADLVLVDCDDDDLLIDPSKVDERITDRTRAVIGVDLYGQIAAFERLAELLADRDVALLEDAAQAHGATRHGSPIGTGVAAAATSFYPGKNLGAYGDGGAVLTSDTTLAQRIRAISCHGGLERYEHRYVGFNSRLDTLQAVVLRAKLRRLPAWNEARRAAAARYDSMLADLEKVRRPTTADGNEHVWHLYVVRVDDRDRVLDDLHAAGIGAGIHYPRPIHCTEAFSFLGHATGAFPVAEASAPQLLTLPLFPHITQAQQERVVEALAEATR